MIASRFRGSAKKANVSSRSALAFQVIPAGSPSSESTAELVQNLRNLTPETATGGEAEPSKLALGQRVFRSGNVAGGVMACAGCHGPNGRGNPGAGYASIQGQHATYAAAQLRAYRSGARGTDPNQMMRNVAAQLSDEQIDAVASYLQGLR